MKKKQFVHRLVSHVEYLTYGFQLNFKGMEKLPLIKETNENEGFFLNVGYDSFLKSGNFSQHYTVFKNLKYQEKEGLFFLTFENLCRFCLIFLN